MKLSLKLLDPGRIICMILVGIFLVGLADCIHMWFTEDWRGQPLLRHVLIALTLWDAVWLLVFASLLFPPRLRPWRLLWHVTVYPNKRRTRRPRAPKPRSTPRSDPFPMSDA